MRLTLLYVTANHSKQESFANDGANVSANDERYWRRELMQYPRRALRHSGECQRCLDSHKWERKS